MLKSITLATGLTLLAVAATAQTSGTNAAPPAEGAERGADPRPERGGRDRGMVARHHPGMAGRMAAMTTGFVLDLGEDRSLQVFCGDESIGTCMEAVRPLIDQLPSLSNRD